MDSVPSTGYPLIIELDELDVNVVTLRHKIGVERRVEVVVKRTGQPIISLSPGDARGLGFILRRRGEEG